MKIISVSLLLFIFLISGCGSSKSSTSTPQQPQQQTTQQQSSSQGHGLIKGNINSKGEKIYHVPGGRFYDKCVPEQWFKTEQEAQAAGFRPSKR